MTSEATARRDELLPQDKTDAQEDAERAKACQEMIASLTDDEKEKAALCSYRYFCLDRPSADERDMFAMATARRHLVAEKGHRERALTKMRATLRYRDEMNVDVIRGCFYGADFPDDATRRLHEEHRDALGGELSEGKLFVRGRSRDGRALYVVLTHRFASGFSPEWYMKYNIYTLERAIACTERGSDGELEKVVVVFDFGQYSRTVSPPVSLQKELMFCLRDHYPERVKNVILVDAPFVFRAVWTIVRPFIDPVTRAKVKFVTHDDQKRDFLGELISEDQAMPFMLPAGKKTKELDMKAYLFDTPFDCMPEEEQ